MIDVGAPIPVETLSPGELRFEHYRRRVGLVLAPAVFVTLLLVPTPDAIPVQRTGWPGLWPR